MNDGGETFLEFQDLSELAILYGLSRLAERNDLNINPGIII